MDEDTNFLQKLIGKIIDDKYLIEKELGRGGMGAVYRGTHLGTQRPVAVKVISPTLMNDSSFLERFQCEAIASGRLRHPNVVNVTDFGNARFEGKQLAYLVMEYLDGTSLADFLLQHRQLPLKFIADITEQLCLAIDHAHQQGIIHCDLKPQNIWLQPDGRGAYNVKVLDFGLAKLRTTSEQRLLQLSTDNDATEIYDISPENLCDTGAATQIQKNNALYESNSQYEEKNILEDMTAASISPQIASFAATIMGTPLYMSPEQCRCCELTPSSDIYSLGVILYQMLTGETPFSGTALNLIFHHTRSQVPFLRKKRPNIPLSLEKLVLSMLSKTPHLRPTNGLAISISLRTIVEGEKPILNLARSVSQKYNWPFFIASLLVYTPFILFANIITTFQPAFFWLWLPFLMVASVLNIAAHSVILREISLTTETTVGFPCVFSLIIKMMPSLLKTGLLVCFDILKGLIFLIWPGMKSYHRSYLYPSVLVWEEKSGRAAIERSSQLMSNLRYCGFTLQLYDLLVHCTLILVMFMTGYLSYSLGFQESESSWMALCFFLVNLVLPIILVPAHSPYAIASVFFYFRCRQAAGESINIQDKIFAQLDARFRMYSIYASTVGDAIILILKRTVYAAAAYIFLALVIILSLSSINKKKLVHEAEHGNDETVKELIDIHGFNVDKRDNFGRTALIVAASTGRKSTVLLLLERKAEVDTKVSAGYTALMEASRRGYLPIVRILLQHKANINLQNAYGRTAIMEAISEGYTPVVQELLKAGADISIKNNDGEDAMQVAINKKYPEITEMIKKFQEKGKK